MSNPQYYHKHKGWFDYPEEHAMASKGISTRPPEVVPTVLNGYTCSNCQFTTNNPNEMSKDPTTCKVCADKISEFDNPYTFGTNEDAIRQIEDRLGSEGSREIAEKMYKLLWNDKKIEYHNGMLRPVIKTDQEFDYYYKVANEEM